MTQRTELGKTTLYAYDYENRLIKVSFPQSFSGNPDMQVRYRYDPLGRRVAKTITQNSELITHNYVYDGDNIIAEYDASGALLKKNLFGPGTDEILSTIDYRLSTTYYYHKDALGSIVQITDSSGQKTESYEYDAFGNLLTPASSIGNRYYFTGRELDSETGLYYYRNRYYDPSLGRFITQDPIGIADDINLYAYCFNDPVNFTDPMGLEGKSNQNVGEWFDDALIKLEDFSMAMAANPMSDGSPYPFEQLWLIGATSSKVGRVFWSGSKVAMMRARKFAEQTGRATLEMTKAGKRLQSAKIATRQGWIYASQRFAKGAEGAVHVFQTNAVKANSTWKMYEEPILRASSKVNEIIKHIIGD